jgi:hypothetical protein
MFDLEKDSEADAKTAISFAPAAIAASNPCKTLDSLVQITSSSSGCNDVRTYSEVRG